MDLEKRYENLCKAIEAIENGAQSYNIDGQSVTLGMGAGEVLTVSVDGADEEAAMADIEKYLTGGK